MMRLWLIMLLGSAVAVSCPGWVFADELDSARKQVVIGHNIQARQMLQTRLRHHPEDFEAWFLLGVVHARLKEYHQAIEAFHQVSRLRPKMAEPHQNLAVIYNELGDLHTAVQELKAALKKSPGHATTHENLADLYIKLALRHYKAALDRQPHEKLLGKYERLLHVRDPMGPAAETQQNGVAKAEKAADEVAVLAAVRAWRKALNAGNVQDYIASYARDYVPGRFQSRQAWRLHMRSRIADGAAYHIELGGTQIQIITPGKRVRTRFQATVATKQGKRVDDRELVLERRQTGWKIVYEASR